MAAFLGELFCTKLFLRREREIATSRLVAKLFLMHFWVLPVQVMA